MINTIKRIDYKTIQMKRNGEAKMLKRKPSSIGLKVWYDIKGEIYA